MLVGIDLVYIVNYNVEEKVKRTNMERASKPRINETALRFHVFYDEKTGFRAERRAKHTAITYM